MPYRSTGFSRYKSRPDSRWRSPSICDHSSVTRTAGREEEGTLPLIKANNASRKQGQSSHTEDETRMTEGVSWKTTCLHANQADLLLMSGVGAGFGVLLFVIVRQRRRCSERRGVLSPAFMCSSSVETRNGAFPVLIPRPAFLSTICGITALESHREHLPCTLSLSTRKQSRHSNASDRCSIGLINGWAISTSFRVGDTTGKLSVGSSKSRFTFGALGFLRVEQSQT